MKKLPSLTEMEHITSKEFGENMDAILDRITDEDIALIIDHNSKSYVLCPASWFDLRELKHLELMVRNAVRFVVSVDNSDLTETVQMVKDVAPALSPECIGSLLELVNGGDAKAGDNEWDELRQALGKWAGEINKKYRRGMSEATSALRRLNQLNAEQKDLEDKIDSGAITSDEKREQIAEQLKQIAKKREAEEKTVRKAQERGTFDAERKETVEKILAQTETASKKITSLNKKVVNADYATKHDLPSSYSRDERKLYQRIITVIDTFFTDNPQTAEKLREAIKTELSVKKK